MGRSVEVQAKTIDLAIEEALVKLGAAQEDVDVVVLSSGGMFKKPKVLVTVKDKAESKAEEAPEVPQAGKAENKAADRFSGKEQQAEKTGGREKETKKEQDGAKFEKKAETGESGIKFTKTFEFVKGLVELLGNDSTVTDEMTERGYNININGGNVGGLIGKGGEVLNAVQVLVSSIAISNAHGEGKRVYVNIEDYKERREQTLKAMAIKKAEQVKASGKYVKLEPMNSRDRAIIHGALTEVGGIKTYSTGKDPFRCLCIAPAEAEK